MAQRNATAPIKFLRCVSDKNNQDGESLQIGHITNLSSISLNEQYWLVGQFDTNDIIGGKLLSAEANFYCESIEAEGGISGSEFDRYHAIFYHLNDDLNENTIVVNDLYGVNALLKPGYEETPNRFYIATSYVATFGLIGTDEWEYVWQENEYEHTNFNNGNANDVKKADRILATKKFAVEIGVIEGSIGDNRKILAKVSGKNSQNPPYLNLLLEDVVIQVASANPASGFINKTIKNTFSWNIVYDAIDVVGTIKPATAKFRWKEKNAAAYTEVSVTGASYTVPANTFGSNDIQWQVEVTTNAGTVATSEWYTVSTIDTAAIAVPVSPVNQKLNRDEANTFKWNHSTENGTAQTAADLQYSSNSLSWQSLATVTGSEQSVTVSAGKLPLGTVFWRVRTYNANGVAGAWSDPAIITVVGAVPAPSISSITGNAMPAIKWSAQIQQAYQVQIQNESGIVFDSGAQLGTAKTYSIGTLLPDGQYTAKVRVYADNGTASDWASSPFAISTTKPSAPSISAQSGIGQVVISVVADSTDTVYILRDGVPIGTAQNGAFTDYSSVGRSRYTARAISGDNRYADSAPVTAESIIRGSIIAAADDLSKSVSLMLNLGGMPTREFNWAPMGGIAHYAGRKYPDFQYTEQEEESYNFSFAFRTKAEFDSFMQLCKKRGTVLYRDQYGLKFYGVITGVSPNIQWAGWAVTFSMTRVENSEAVSYA